MSEESHIVVASSDLEIRRHVLEIVNKLGLDPICTSTIGQFREVLAHNNVDLVICDQKLSDGGYVDLLAATCLSNVTKVRVVLMSSVLDPEEYHAARRLGLFEVIASPCRPTDVEWIVIRAKRDEHTRAK